MKPTPRIPWCVALLVMQWGCAPVQAVRPPAAVPTLDAAGRQKLYDDWHLETRTRELGLALPLVRVFPSTTWKRADGSYEAGQVRDLMAAYPETRKLSSFRWAPVLGYLGMELGLEAAWSASVIPLAGLYATIAIAEAPGVFFGIPDPDETDRLRMAYNRALAADLGLAPPPREPVAEGHRAGAGWLGGSLGLEGFMGLSAQPRDDFDALYAGGIRWNSAKLDGPPLLGAALDYAFSDRLQVGVLWEPWLPKRETIHYRNGFEDRWNLDAAGVLGRVRLFLPASPTLGVVLTLAAGRYALSGAGLVTNYWYGRRSFAGSSAGGSASVGFEHLIGRSAGLYTGVGYRMARIEPIIDDRDWVWHNPDRSRAFVDHSGVFFQTSWRFYWGVARRS